eukprot:1701036-Rhodomonas_salina.1
MMPRTSSLSHTEPSTTPLSCPPVHLAPSGHAWQLCRGSLGLTLYWPAGHVTQVQRLRPSAAMCCSACPA